MAADIDWGAIEAAEGKILAGAGAVVGHERDLVRVFREMAETGHFDDRLPQSSALDACVCEMSFRYGRADIVIFHADGSASVVEAKDGAKGYSYVVAGIGQAGLYAAQLAMSKGALTRVRKCLLWSSTGDLWLDALIEMACEQAGVIPLPMGHMKKIMAAGLAVRQYFVAA